MATSYANGNNTSLSEDGEPPPPATAAHNQGGWTTAPFIIATMFWLTLAAGGWLNNLIVFLINHQSSYFNWYFCSLYTASFIAITGIVYVEDSLSWGWGFGICIAANALGLALFFVGSTSLLCVFVASVRKRKAVKVQIITMERKELLQRDPQRIQSLATAMVAMLIGVAFYLSGGVIDFMKRVTDWLADDIDDGRLDCVYWVGVANFGYFLVISCLYKYGNVEVVKEDLSG